MAYWYHQIEFRAASPNDVVEQAVAELQEQGEFEDFRESDATGLNYYANGDLSYQSSNAIADILRQASAKGADSEIFSSTNSDDVATDVTFYERGRMNTMVDSPYCFLDKAHALASLDAETNPESAAILSQGFANAETDVEDCYDHGTNLAALAAYLVDTDFVPSVVEAEGWKQACLALGDSDFSDPDTTGKLMARAEAVLSGAMAGPGSGKIRHTGL